MVTIAHIRNSNNRFGYDPTLALYCPACERLYSADLAGYWKPRDAEEFLCPECDGEIFVAQLAFARDELPLAQRQAYQGRHGMFEVVPAGREP